jgi:hypothetical protein
MDARLICEEQAQQWNDFVRSAPRGHVLQTYHWGQVKGEFGWQPRVWAVRTADGRYAKLEIVGYYCPEAHPGCLTFRYVFQGDGTNRVGIGDA